MDPKKKSSSPTTWFRRLFLDNQTVVSLMILLLSLLCVYMLTKLTFLFKPIQIFFDTVGIPILATLILYFLLVPMVNWLVKRGFSRSLAIITIFVVILLLIIWGGFELIPILRRQTTSLIENLPNYAQSIFDMLETQPYIHENQTIWNQLLSYIDFSAFTDRMNEILSTSFGSLSSVFGAVSSFVTGLLILPIMLYYALLRGDRIIDDILYFVPTKNRPTVSRILYQTNYQIAQYIRGQILVAISVAIMFTIGYSFIGLDYAVTLGVMSGFLNIIPFLGSFIAAIPAVIIGLLTSPAMFVKALLVLMIEQTIEGRLISPQILGNSMEIHPVTILLVLLAAGNMFGLVGVIAGVPGYAILKVIVTELYTYYRQRSGLYEVEEPPSILTSDQMDTH